MNLKEKKWKEFHMFQIFDIFNGIGITEEEVESNMGDFEVVQGGSKNNGIFGYIDKEYCKDCNYTLSEDACITIARVGTSGYVSFHENGCVVGDKAKILKPKKHLNTSQFLFLLNILTILQQKYGYGARGVEKDGYLNEIIMLPVNELDEPDYSFMSLYIESLNGDLEDIPDYFLEEGYDKAFWYIDNIDQEKFEENYAGSYSKETIGERSVKPFKINDIFDDIHNGKSYNKSDLINAEGTDYIAYVTRKDNNNGIAKFVQNDDYDGKEKGGAITIGDTTATAFYQNIDFVTGPHIIVLRANWLNIYTGVYIVTLLNAERIKYPVFGRAFTKDNIKDTVIYLPVNDEGKPDYEFMERYIKTLPFSCSLVD